MYIKKQPHTKYPWYIRLIFWLQYRKYGKILDSTLIWSRSPQVFLSFSLLYKIIDRKKSPILSQLRRLIILKVSQLNECVFCQDLNTAILIKADIGISKVNALSHWKESEQFNEDEKSVLAFVEAITFSKGPIKYELYKNLSKYFSEDQIVEIAIITAFQNMSTKFNNAFNIKSQGFSSKLKG